MLMASALQLPCQVISSRLSPNRAHQLVGLGGNDGAVHVYPFGGYNQVSRLDGSSSPVTALTFDPQQHRLVGGNDSGGVSLWDVTTEKFVRSFGKGHKSTITGADYHRYGEFIATCSRDTNLRIWDNRKSACLQSYKGVQVPLCAVQFCPSGRWVASGCAEGVVRLYDLTAGRSINEFRAHTGSITSIHFHPEQYFMAVGSNDGSVSLWDLENFTMVFQSHSLRTPIDAVHLYGKKLFAAADHVLRTYDFASLSDSKASSLVSPWSIVGDFVYSSMDEEVWFVEFGGTSARMGRLPASHSPNSNIDKDSNHADLDNKHNTPRTKQIVRPALDSKGINEVILRPTPSRTGSAASCESRVPILEKKTSEETGATTPPSGKYDNEDSLVRDLIKSSVTMSSVLHRRLTHIRVIRTLWAKDPQQAMEHLKKLSTDETENGVLTDFFNSLQNLRMKERINVENLPDLLELLTNALKIEHEPLLLLALKTLKSMNSKFRAKLDDARRFASSFRNDVDGVLDTRMRPYYELLKKFESITSLVYTLADRKGSVGDEARDALSELPPVPHLV